MPKTETTDSRGYGRPRSPVKTAVVVVLVVVLAGACVVGAAHPAVRVVAVRHRGPGHRRAVRPRGRRGRARHGAAAPSLEAGHRPVHRGRGAVRGRRGRRSPRRPGAGDLPGDLPGSGRCGLQESAAWGQVGGVAALLNFMVAGLVLAVFRGVRACRWTVHSRASCGPGRPGRPGAAASPSGRPACAAGPGPRVRPPPGRGRTGPPRTVACPYLIRALSRAPTGV